MLRETMEQFREKKILSVSQLAIHFSVDQSAMKGILESLERRKYITNLNTECTSCSSSCASCSFASEKDFYILVEN